MNLAGAQREEEMAKRREEKAKKRGDALSHRQMCLCRRSLPAHNTAATDPPPHPQPSRPAWNKVDQLSRERINTDTDHISVVPATYWWIQIRYFAPNWHFSLAPAQALTVTTPGQSPCASFIGACPASPSAPTAQQLNSSTAQQLNSSTDQQIYRSTARGAEEGTTEASE